MNNRPPDPLKRIFRPSQWPPFFRSTRFWFLVVLVIAVLLALNQQFDLETVRAQAARLHGGLAFLLLLVLPLIGVPASALHVVAGLRFGIPLGLVLVWISILFQLLVSYALVHWQRAFFTRRFKSVRDKIPPGAHAPVTVFTMLIPGAPYFAQNYVLPLLGVPLRTYLGICLPMHATRSSIAVILGGQSHHLTPGRVALMLAYCVVLLTASWWTLRRMQAKLGDRPPGEHGRKQPA